jgi:N-acetylmuramoyl-L-alanine amidase
VLYERAMIREATVRKKLEAARPPAAALAEARRVAQSYEELALTHPTSGYSDNAFWQAGRLTADVYTFSGQEPDRLRAIRLFKAIPRNYPGSSLIAKATAEVARLDAPRAGAAAEPALTARTLAAPPGPAVSAPKPAADLPRPEASDARDGRMAPGAPGAAASQMRSAPPEFTAPASSEDEGAMRAKSPTDERILTVPDASRVATRELPPAGAPSGPESDTSATTGTPGLVRAISRTTLGTVERVIIELDREQPFHDELIADPDRVFVDVRGVRVAREARRTQKFSDGFVKQIRVGERPDSTTRVVLDLEHAASYSIFTLYNPFRVVIDCERARELAPLHATHYRARLTGAPTVTRSRSAARLLAPAPGPPLPAVTTASNAVSAASENTAKSPVPLSPVAAAGDDSTLPARRAGTAGAAAAPALPSPPSANLQGRFSLSRQLGLGIARIVIDAGHGGHDPGARVKGLNEAELVLDVALRLEQLLLKQPGVEVVLTRRTDVFIPLEERTAIANREGADLFLSIHANASRNTRARGVETYFLNFASNPDAQAVAARENAASGRTMHSLPDIVKAITLNNKIDESRDFASMVQKSMVQRLSGSNKSLRDLGVKQAPFVVLIGAVMPSVLAEISFVTHPQEGRLLKSGAYRQRIADALFDGVAQYQRSLKTVRTVATQ